MSRLILLLIAFPCLGIVASAQSDPVRVIIIGAHPDDCDSDAGGTAALWASMGHAVKCLSVTNGDAGHQSMGGGALARIRREEAREAGRRMGIDEYETLDNHDGELVPSLDVRLQIIRQIRNWNADLVVGPRPNDYHPDHRYTGILVQDAAYMVGVPNIAPDTPALSKNPVFLYSQDHFQRPNPFRPDIAVDITATVSKKWDALDAHVSQMYEWLPWIGGYLNEVPEGAAERRAWLESRRSGGIAPDIREALVKWYGADHAAGVKAAEAFEICEYGSRPSREDILRLFPMLPR